MIKQKKLLLRCVDDSVIIMAFVLEDNFSVHRKGTKKEIEAEIKKASQSFPQERMPIVSWEEITDDDIPKDRTFRNAWITKKPKFIEYDMVKARTIHRDHLRRVRQLLLDRLDVEYQRADEEKDEVKKQDIVKQKQVLRDIPNDPRIENADTPEALKLLTIDTLIIHT